MGKKVEETFLLGGEFRVNRMGFGAMQLTGEGRWHWFEDRQQAAQVLRRAVELGIQLIDTADAYGPEVNEYLIAEALKPYGKDVVIATKGGMVRGGPGQWSRDGRPEHLQRAVMNSLRRLEVEQIDLYQLHTIDEEVALEESLGAIREMQEKGYIRHIGVSNFNVEQLERARQVVDVVSVQNRYSVGDREQEEVVDYCEEHGLGFLPWRPLAVDKLQDRQGLEEVAKRHGATVRQIGLAWLLHRSPVILPIPGTSSPAHLEENFAGSEIELSEQDMAELSGLS